MQVAQKIDHVQSIYLVHLRNGHTQDTNFTELLPICFFCLILKNVRKIFPAVGLLFFLSNVSFQYSQFRETDFGRAVRTKTLQAVGHSPQFRSVLPRLKTHFFFLKPSYEKLNALSAKIFVRCDLLFPQN